MEEAERRRFKPSWFVAMAGVGVVVGCVTVGLMKLVNDPVEVTADSLPRLQASLAPRPSKAPTNLLTGLHVSFTYPGEFDQLSQVKTSARTLEQYMLSSKSNYRHTIAVEVDSLSPAGLSDDSNYRVRQIHANDYKESRESVGKDTVVFMTKVDGQEQTMFWMHGDMVLTVAITTSDGKDDVKVFMAMVKGSVKWQG